MATSDNNSSLISKVVSFVSTPVLRRGAPEETDVAATERSDKAAIQAMMDRKLQNDLVRKREFELLRQMRKREPAANRIDLNDRTSLFPTSTLSRPGGRAQTIKKIDEIEQQMSQQWWKGKQVKAFAGTKGSTGPTSLTVPAAPAVVASLSVPAPAAPDSKADYIPYTEEAMHSRLEASLLGDVPGSVASEFPPTQVERFAYDPVLEDAAIQFANGNFDGARDSLTSLLRDDKPKAEQEEFWLAQFDLYRATGNRASFDNTAIDYAARYGRSAPQWGNAIVGSAPVPMDAGLVIQSAVGETHWVAPAQLGPENIKRLQQQLKQFPEPWRLDWSALTSIQEAALPDLSALIGAWCREKHELRFTGQANLESVLQAATPTGEQDVSRGWWLLRLDCLRLADKEDDFELAALDYCITYEMSPPPWEPAASNMHAGGSHSHDPSALPDSELEPLFMGEELMSTLAGALPGQAGTAAAAVAKPPQSEFGLVEFSDEITGDAETALAKLNGLSARYSKVVIDCGHLVRIDFPAAGNLLNWVTTFTAAGSKVEFKNINRLVATFLSVIGIDEFARIIPPTH